MKKNFLNSEGMQNFGLLVARLTVAAIFISAGWMKFNNLEMVTGMLEGLSFPIPAVFAYILAATELVGGIAVLLGIFTRVFALLLAFTMVVALFTAHAGDMLTGGSTPLALVGSTMALVASGGGAWKLWSKKCSWS